MDLLDKIKSIAARAEGFAGAGKEELEAFRIEYLGRKGELKSLYEQLKDVPNENKKVVGQAINDLKVLVNSKLEAGKSVAGDLKTERQDLSRPGSVHPIGSRHPISLVKNEIVDIFSRIGFTISEGPEIRTISPGRVFRNEAISARSHCIFHQIEGLYIDKGVSFADLKQTLLYFAKEFLGESTDIRLRPSYFPFTEPSAEVDVYWGLETETDKKITKGTGWLEIMGCGMVDPQVLTNNGIDPEVYSGFAFGMGVERIAMLKYQVPDIRMFFENDMRFLEQFKSAF